MDNDRPTPVPSTQTPKLANAQKASKRGRIFAVASGKGGVGKTWFSVTLAQALAAQGKRVLLFDGDLGLANVDIQLGLMPQVDLGDVVTGRLTLNQAARRYEAGGYDVISGRSGSGSLANIPISKLQLLAEDLLLMATRYDIIILDLGAGVDRANRALARLADRLLVLTSDEPTSLTDAYAFIKVTVSERPSADVSLVVNAANSTREGERTYQTLLKACRSFLKLAPPLAGIVRRDPKVREAIRHQTPILTRSPNSEAAVDVEQIADTLLSRI